MISVVVYAVVCARTSRSLYVLKYAILVSSRLKEDLLAMFFCIVLVNG